MLMNQDLPQQFETLHQYPPAVQAEVHSMIAHWLATPTNAYLGSPYGAGASLKLMRSGPQTEAGQETVTLIFRRDLPIFSNNRSLKLSWSKNAADALVFTVSADGRDFVHTL